MSAGAVLLGPAAPTWAWDRYAAGLPYLVAVSGQFDTAFERAARTRAESDGTPLLSIRATATEAVIGPVGGCAGCAHLRSPGTITGVLPFGLEALVAAYLPALATVPLGPGELVALAADGTARRHRVAPRSDCPLCGALPDTSAGVPDSRPPARTLVRHTAVQPLPTRGGRPFGLDPTRMRREVLGPRFGPMTRLRRKGLAAFAMTEATIQGSEYSGFGRGRTYRSADLIAGLEAYERFAGVPREATVVTQVSRTELGDLAIDPAGLGAYTSEQLAAPGARVRGYADEVPLDWVWGHRLRDGEPLLVPAEVGFYRYAYPVGRAGFAESSSGSALGGSYEEAALHSLIELAERDAFLQAWHGAMPLRRIDASTVQDGESRMLADIVTGQGYDLHLLVATADIPIPVVWACAVHREHRFPATFSSAGAGPEPVEAIRGALWELGQLVTAGRDLDRTAADALDGDPWRVRTLEDHIRFNALPDRIDRVSRVLGGPVVPLADAFPGWPWAFIEAAAGDVTGALEFVATLYADAGMPDIVIVDQSTSEHHRVGLSAVKAVVPGIVPMCFGQAEQRLAGLPRFERRWSPRPATELPGDPHPFP